MVFQFIKVFIMTVVSVATLGAGASGLKPVHTVEGISEYVLSNGLKVVLFEDRSKPTATVNTTYLVGSRHENYGETGMAHLLEHLLFKGSRNFPDPDKEFARRGFRMNGTTWLDRTNFFVSFTANDDNMRWALAWSADAMVNSNIAKNDLETEMTVVRNEYEMGENKPVSVMLKRMQSVLFDWHSYGRSTIGARSDIENVPIENLQAFYRKWYQPDNAVLTVSGSFDTKKVLRWIEESFGKIAKPTRTLPHEWTVEPVADGPRYFQIRRPGEMQLVAVGYRVPSGLSDESMSVDAAVQILSDAPRGRLYKALVETGLASQVFGWHLPGKCPGFVLFGAMVKKGEALEPVRTTMIEAIEKGFQKKGVTAQELKVTTADTETAFERTLSDPEAFAVDLSDYISLGDWRLFFVNRDKNAKLTQEAVNRAAQTYFVRDNRVVGEFIPDDKPQRAPEMTTPALADVLSGAHFSEAGDTGEAFDVSQENIMRRTERFQVGDVAVALLPKKTRGKTVTVIASFQYGNLKAAQGKSVVAGMLEALLTRGAEGLDKNAIADRLTELKVQGDVFSFTCTHETLPETLSLMGKLLTTSTFPEKEVKQYARQYATALAAKSDNPMTLGRDALVRHFRLYPDGDSRNTLTTEEIIDTLKTVDRKACYDWYRNVFSTEHGAVAVIGDFDAKAVRVILEKTLGTKKSVGKENAYERYFPQFKPVPAARFVIDTPQKENAAVFARMDFPGNFRDEDAPAMEVANWILGGGTSLSSRLMERLRQKEGLSYSVYSQILLPGYGNRAAWIAYAIVAPQNLAKAEKSMRDEITKALEKGFTKQEVSEAVEGLLQSRAVNRAQDAHLARSWITFLDTGTDFTESKRYENRLRALDVNAVNAALRKMLKADGITFALAGDLAKAKKAGTDFSAP